MPTRKGSSCFLTRTLRARLAAMGVLLILAACSWHPMGASLSGALDRVLFDVTARWLAHPSTDQVALVVIDDETRRAYGESGWMEQTSGLLRRLDRAASVTMDLTLAPGAHAEELAGVVADHGRVVLPAAPGKVASILHAAAAAKGHRQVTVGHYGVVSGFIPEVAAAQGGSHLVMEAVRVADANHAGVQAHLRPHAFSVSPERMDAVLIMLGSYGHLPQYSFMDVADGRVDPAAFADRLVFVGHAIGDDAGFQLSSLDMEAVSRAQLYALMADAVLSGNLASELSAGAAVPIYLAFALGMMLICGGIRSRWMHLAALGWVVLLLLFPVGLLTLEHRWLGLGLLPLVCAGIYAYFAWERLGRTQGLLRREIRQLRAITASVGGLPVAAGAPERVPADPLRQVRQAMREIRGLQSIFAGIVNQLPYPLFVVTDGRVSVWNAGAAEVLSGERDMSLAQLQMLVARHCRGDTAAAEEVALGGREYMLLSTPFAGIDTTLHPAMAQGRGAYLLCLVDIAGIKQGVAHDRQALRHIAHDLRGPLSTILTLIEERAAGPRRDTSPDQAFLDDLRRQADYSLRVAKDFLQLSRAEQIQRETFAPMALSDIAAEAVDQLWVAAEAKSITLAGPECVLDSTSIKGQADMLIRALINVLDNAIKYSPPDSTVAVRIDDAGEEGLALHVIDRGVGIAAHDLPHLFDPFFQVDGKGGVERGVGLGLPFVKTVVERHGGEVRVGSKPGQGTDVCLLLPKA